MSHGEATIIIREPVNSGERGVGKIRVYRRTSYYDIKEKTGMHRLLKLIRLFAGWDYSVKWDFSGEHAVARVKWPRTQ